MSSKHYVYSTVFYVLCGSYRNTAKHAGYAHLA